MPRLFAMTLGDHPTSPPPSGRRCRDSATRLNTGLAIFGISLITLFSPAMANDLSGGLEEVRSLKIQLEAESAGGQPPVPDLAKEKTPLASFIDQIILAYGKPETPQTIRQNGRTESLLRGQGPVERLFKWPDQLRFQVSYPKQSELRMQSGERGWYQMRPMNEMMLAALEMQTIRMGFPWRLRDEIGKVTDLGEGRVPELEGQIVRTLQFVPNNRVVVFADIDPQTHRILSSRGVILINGAQTEFQTLYKSFSMQEGRLVPMVEEHIAQGRHTGRTVLDSVLFDQAIEDAQFAPEPPRQDAPLAAPTPPVMAPIPGVPLIPGQPPSYAPGYAPGYIPGQPVPPGTATYPSTTGMAYPPTNPATPGYQAPGSPGYIPGAPPQGSSTYNPATPYNPAYNPSYNPAYNPAYPGMMPIPKKSGK